MWSHRQSILCIEFFCDKCDIYSYSKLHFCLCWGEGGGAVTLPTFQFQSLHLEVHHHHHFADHHLDNLTVLAFFEQYYKILQATLAQG